MKYRNKSLRERLLRCIQQYLIGVVVVLLCPTTIASAQTAEQIAEKALAATVYLEMKDGNGTTLGFGSGFFVKENLIATNYHVIEGAAQGTAKLVGKYTTYTIEGLTAIDEKNDLALLKVTAYGIAPLPLGDSDDAKIGATVYVAGNPLGLEGTFSDGIISSKQGGYSNERLQMTAPISPGSSGGPVLNSKGEVIGVSVVSSHNLASQNLNFAIPSNYLKVLLTHSVTNKSLWQDRQSISAETYLKWGNAKYNMGLYQEAISDFDKAIRLKRGYAEAYNNRGFAKDSLGQHFPAISDFDRAIQLKPDFADAYNNRGNAKANLNQHFAAVSDYDTVIRLRPDYAGGYYNRGIRKYYLGQYKEAITDYDMAIRLKPDLVEAYVNRGIAKDRLRQHFDAISDYDMAIRLKPNYPDAYYARGNAKSRMEQYDAAVEDYDTAIGLKPNYPDVYYARGNAKMELKQYDAAITDYNQAIHLKSDYADAYVNRGKARTGMGQYIAAISDCDKAIRLKPDDAYAYNGRGIAKALLGHTWEAKQDLRTALKLAEKAGDASLKANIEQLLRNIN